VEDASGCEPGDCVEVGSGSSLETVCIADVEGDTLVLTTPTANAHSAGEAVVLGQAASPSPTPAGLPDTGGFAGGGGSSSAWLMALLAALLIAGVTAYQRARARRDA
jgi:hypothetical protein